MDKMKVLTNLLKELSLNGFKLKKKRTGNAYIRDDLHCSLLNRALPVLLQVVLDLRLLGLKVK